MRVAVIQLASGVDSSANRRLIDRRLGEIDEADLVLLPEATMHDFGSADHDLAAPAESLDGPFVEVLAGHAGRIGATVVAGMFERTAALPFNTLVAVGPSGDLVATYRKVHLYDSFGYRESDRLAPGAIEPVVVDVAGTPVGLMTCYDLRFPEMARFLVDAGAEVMALPAAWVAGEHKLHHWRTLLTARAIENTVAVVSAAQSAPRYTGHSTIIDAMGLTLAEAGDADETIEAVISPDNVSAARDVNPSLANRRMR